jgi:hypothetical protein
MPWAEQIAVTDGDQVTAEIEPTSVRHSAGDQAAGDPSDGASGRQSLVRR